MMRDHDGRARERLVELSRKKRAVHREAGGGVFRREWRRRRLARANSREVVHEAPSFLHRGGAPCRTIEREIGPERASEEADAMQRGFVVVENSDVRPRAELPKRCKRSPDASAVELMIARHVEHRLFERRRPCDRLRGSRDIAGEDDHIGIGGWPGEVALSQMQVGQDVELHRSAATRKALGSTTCTGAEEPSRNGVSAPKRCRKATGRLDAAPASRERGPRHATRSALRRGRPTALGDYLPGRWGLCRCWHWRNVLFLALPPQHEKLP